jgi:carboxylate-amine ligase
MNTGIQDSFGFGLEAEFLLVEASSFRPLWHPDLRFETLNAVLEAIPVDDFQCDGFKVESPHRKPGPYVVEGYHLPDQQMNPIDLLPKGVEIRTPVRPSIEECLAAHTALHGRLQHALADIGFQAAALSFHPTQVHFSGPQNKRRHDHWQWAMAAMLTYGPDINISLPEDLTRRINFKDLNEKVNYYVPALVALTLASPLHAGTLWRIRGRIGKSVRTYHRSVVAPAVEIHPKEGPRFELKPFEMTGSLVDYRNYFLLWLTLLVDESLKGRASDETRIYDLGRIACVGLEAETVYDRASAVMDRAPRALGPWGFDCASLDSFRRRLKLGHLPSDDIVSVFERERTISGTLRHLANLA